MPTFTKAWFKLVWKLQCYYSFRFSRVIFTLFFFFYFDKILLYYTDNFSTLIYFRFLIPSYGSLTHIRLNSCKFVTNETIEVLSQCKQLKELGLRNCTTVSSKGFYCLEKLSQLEYLDLYRTNITCQPLIEILKNNKNLLHLNLGSILMQ